MTRARDKYKDMQKDFYNKESANMRGIDHKFHSGNPNYWNILLPPEGTGSVLDFGCGTGRSVGHLLELGYDAEGCDISSENIDYCRGEYPVKFYVTDGVSLNGVPSNKYDLVVSTITLQHICVYEIRLAILKDIFRVLKKGGRLSFQMGYGNGHPNSVGYYDNHYEAEGTNGGEDVEILDYKNLVKDLEQIGFENIQHKIRDSFEDSHPKWIFIKCGKP